MNFVFHRTYYTKSFCLKKKKKKKNVYRSFIYINKLYIIGGRQIYYTEFLQSVFSKLQT